MIHQFYFCVHAQKNWKQGLEEVAIYPFSWQHSNSQEVEVPQVSMNK
jgi:hypothetical protein